MTVDERVALAMSGLRLRTDELGRPPSHDEVEAVLRKALEEVEADHANRTIRQSRDAYCATCKRPRLNSPAGGFFPCSFCAGDAQP